MSERVKGNHPLAEVIACKLFGIEGVPREEQGKMVNRAAMAAVKWHEAENASLRAEVERLRHGPINEG